MIFTVEDFIKFKKLIYEKAGIHFEDRKIAFVKRRIFERMNKLKIQSATDYYRLLRFSDREGKEFQNLINLLTTNETYFFREFYQLEVFGEVLLPELEQKRDKEGFHKIKIWSAGCSTGEEPYTLAIIVKEILDNYKIWDIEILATDIDENVLNKANRGIYDKRSIKDVPIPYLEKYFIKVGGNYKIKDEIKKMVKFEKLNLFDTPNMIKKKNFDFIFCRNVLIYFDDESRRKVINLFFNSLNHNGYIFLGHSESINRITTVFKMRKIKDTIIYFKP